MILLPFIENAYKYASSDFGLPAITIKLKCDKTLLLFKCENKFSVTDTNNIHSGGIGLENVKRRLTLIYPKKHILNIIKESNIFAVELKIYLN
jgi:LytS/YehU family sensor histidine kinase